MTLPLRLVWTLLNPCYDIFVKLFCGNKHHPYYFYDHFTNLLCNEVGRDSLWWLCLRVLIPNSFLGGFFGNSLYLRGVQFFFPLPNSRIHTPDLAYNFFVYFVCLHHEMVPTLKLICFLKQSFLNLKSGQM